MMRPSNALLAVYLCMEAVDFRKHIDGLSILVQEELELDPFSERLFVFINRGRDKMSRRCPHQSSRPWRSRDG